MGLKFLICDDGVEKLRRVIMVPPSPGANLNTNGEASVAATLTAMSPPAVCDNLVAALARAAPPANIAPRVVG